MRLLLDTHVLLWARSAADRLPESVREMLADTSNEKIVSPTSLAEVAVKASIGKLTVPDDFSATVASIGVSIEPFGVDDAAVLGGLPQHHRDPFDRMLVAQAINGRSALVSADPKLRAYDVTVLW